ncbi:S41 family peptidase [Halioxenophilus aromaticivorans]|uniref:S41 family peptidase n=1 Tax=Halioxenophilus aromaticivorans TaxID=1306992 RepID=A0AAV3U5L9_9ALTE
MKFRLLPAALLALSAVSWADTAEEADERAQLPLDDLRTFTKVYSQIRNTYVEEVSDQKLLEYAIKGMLSELDPHSTYLDANSFDDLQMNTTGEYGGLGIEVGMENGFVKVIAPIDDSPASRAGIEAGDLIVTLDDKPVRGMSLSEAIEQMRGPVGSDIVLSIVREGNDQPFDVTLTRDTIKVNSVRARVLEPGYGYLRIAQFQLKTGDDLLKRITKLKQDEPNLKGLVLDLRNNPGGILQSSVKVADAFLNEGLVVYTEGRVENADVKYHATPGDEINGLPMVVLINEGSASASEIVAGALQDHGRAVIMGTDSFGKGSVQTVIPISEDRAIKLTTALYYTPSGRSIQAQGIEPDIIVERAKITALTRGGNFKEADLNGRLENGNGGDALDAKAREERSSQRDDLAARDNQLYEAVNLLKGITIFAKHGQDKSAGKSTQMADRTGD